MATSTSSIQEFFSHDRKILTDKLFRTLELILQRYFSGACKPSISLTTNDEVLGFDTLKEFEAALPNYESTANHFSFAAMENGKHFQLVVQFQNPHIGPNGNITVMMGDKATTKELRDFTWNQLQLRPQGKISLSKEYPDDLAPFVAAFRKDYPEGTKIAFMVMSFASTPAHESIHKTIKELLATHGIVGLRADDKEYAPDLFNNIRTYMHCCTFGMGIFERLQTNDFNPNVSTEVGYLLGLGKQVCLLKDKTLPNLPTDLVGKLYRSFDTQDIRKTIEPELTKWLKDRDLITP